MPKRFAIIAAALARAGRGIPATFGEDGPGRTSAGCRTELAGVAAVDSAAARALGGDHYAKPPLSVDSAYPRISRFALER